MTAKEGREHHGIERGNKVTFVLESKGTATLKALKTSTIASLCGAAGSLPTPLTWEEMCTIAREDRLHKQQQAP